MTEHKIPTARLNQLARRKLMALGIPTQQAKGSDRLEGDITIVPPHELTNPLTGETIKKISFVVEGHDHLRITAPAALSKLPPQPFFDFDRVIPLIEQIITAFQLRLASMKAVSDRLERLKIPWEQNRETASVIGKLELAGMGVVNLEGDERGFMATVLQPPTGGPAIYLGDVPVALENFADRTDLELHMTQLVEQNKGQPVQAPPPPKAVSAAPATKSASKGVSLQSLASAMGEEVMINPGITVGRDLTVGGKPVRFLARHEQGDIFLGKVATAEGPAWTGRFDVNSFPGVEAFVSQVMGVEQVVPTETQPEQAKSVFDADLAMGYQLPVVGEVWIMNFLIEQEDENEVRYVGLNNEGQPFGAPRVLPREAFLKTFIDTGSGVFQILAEVAQVEGGKVTYNRLDAGRGRTGSTTTANLAVFLANFYPEAAMY